MDNASKINKKNYSFLYSCLILAAALFFYFIMPVYVETDTITKNTKFVGGYSFPDGPYWDENYHIASAQKYINGVFFMEPHPPLGKLIIALGERLINPNKNIDTSSFLDTDFINSFPANYSFAGVRFFPVLFSALSAVLFFLILARFSVSVDYALGFTSFFLFDNALLVHLRGAMLEGIQIFFILLAVLYFLILLQKKDKRKAQEYLILGLLTGVAISVKLNSSILLVFFIFLAYEDFSPLILPFKITWKDLADFINKAVLSAAGVLLIFFITFYIHFSIASRVEKGRSYLASSEYGAILNSKETANPVHFFIMLRDYFAFIHNYEKGVPKWTPSKVDENGSPPFGWPFGYKSINYRWSKFGGKVAYLYLQGNPLIWFSGLLGIIMATVFVCGVILFKAPAGNKQEFHIMVYFTILYFIYMATMLTIERVMYLYHYFIPLIFSFFLAFMIFQYYFRDEMKTNDKMLRNISIFFLAEIFCVFLFYAPFSYFVSLDSLSFFKRAWLSVWGLVPVNF